MITENEIVLNTPATDVVLPPVVDCGDSDCETLAQTDEIIPAVGDGCPVEPVQEGISIGAYFGTLLDSEIIAHKYHLKTRKHRDHLALQEYYEGIEDQVDALIEHYQSKFGVVESYSNAVCPEGKCEVEYFNELRDFVFQGRVQILPEENTELWSDVDDILGTIDSVIYKLTTFNEHAIKSYDEFCYENVLESCKCGRCEDFEDFGAEDCEEEE